MATPNGCNGISYVDPDTGHTMMPGTQRPDGTWRKPRRVKEGYTPQDEVPLYESKGKQIAKARAEGGIPGLCTSPINYKIDMFVIPPPVITIPGLSVDPNPTQPSSNAKAKKKKNKAGGGGVVQPVENGVYEVTAKMASASIAEAKRQQPVATDPAKKLRNLRKKLRDIEALEAKIEAAEIENPEKEQLEKVAKKEEVSREIANLEKIVQWFYGPEYFCNGRGILWVVHSKNVLQQSLHLEKRLF